MNILIIGSGGREHALGWKLTQSKQKVKLFFAPGNGGTAQLGTNIDIKVTAITELRSYALKNKIELTLVGSEDPLSLGIVDLFGKKGLAIFGPSKYASQLESSKIWATTFMEKYHIPHPISYTFNNYKNALVFIASHDMSQYVMKANGLALGKGVFLPQTEREAKDVLERMIVRREFGDAGKEVLIQERLVGQEVSLIAITDGNTIYPFLPAQDHKRIYDNDKGPNTGGMGAYAPTPFITKKNIQVIQKTILQPTIEGMKKEKHSYRGVLYAGLMITAQGPKVLEYNVRFGDPETQPLMMLLKSDLLPLLFGSIKGNLKNQKICFHKQASVCVVLSSKGYPGSYKKGEVIHGVKHASTVKTQVFHAGTFLKDEMTYTNGGRVLGITAVGTTIQEAVQNAYSVIGETGVYFKHMHFRKDIGHKAIKNISKP